MKEEVKERIREQRRLMRKEVEKLKREFIKKEEGGYEGGNGERRERI